MPQHIGYIALLVRDYDEAISYFIEKLGFTVAEDTDLGGGKRWVLVAPPGSVETRLVLAYEAYRSRGVVFREGPREEQYGIVAVFEDLYGNRWDLMELKR